MRLELSRQIFEKIPHISNFMKICLIAAELFHADRHAKLIVAFRSFAKAPINVQDVSTDWRTILSVTLRLCVGRRVPDCAGWGREQVAGSFEHRSKCSATIKFREFLTSFWAVRFPRIKLSSRYSSLSLDNVVNQGKSLSRFYESCLKSVLILSFHDLVHSNFPLRNKLPLS